MRYEVEIIDLTSAVRHQLAQLITDALLVEGEKGVKLFRERFNITKEQWSDLDFIKVFNTKEDPDVIHITATKTHSRFAWGRKARIIAKNGSPLSFKLLP